MRLFIGIPLSEEIKARIKPLSEKLEETSADLNLVPLENLHFTLKFLGEVEKERLAEIKQKLFTVQSKLFTISLEKISVFPSEQRINLVWIRIKSKELITLMREINSRLDYIRKDEHEDEIPHLTLARVKSRKNKEQLLAFFKQYPHDSFGKMEISCFYLYQSQLTPAGPIYKILAEFKF